MSLSVSENQLIAASIKGDRQALSNLVEIHSPKIYNLALRIMRNAEDAEDVLQETFVIMINKLKSFSGNSSLYTWLYRIATNVALGNLREKKRGSEVSLNDGEFETLKGSEIEWPEHLKDEILNDEFHECLKKALKELPENYRTVFVLRDLEGLSTKEAAEVLKISQANLKVRLMRARLYLRDQLAFNFNCVER
ncbi:MAG: RNA polymerase sigma factor [Candidatus Neomarinimicrobiota bacterium]